MSRIDFIKGEIEAIIKSPSSDGKTRYLEQERLARLREELAELIKQQSDDDFNRAMCHGNY